MLYLYKQCRSRSVGFLKSQLIWIYTVCHKVCVFLSTAWIKESDWQIFRSRCVLSTAWIKESDWLTVRSGCGILIYSARQGLILSLIVGFVFLLIHLYLMSYANTVDGLAACCLGNRIASNLTLVLLKHDKPCLAACCFGSRIASNLTLVLLNPTAV